MWYLFSSVRMEAQKVQKSFYISQKMFQEIIMQKYQNVCQNCRFSVKIITGSNVQGVQTVQSFIIFYISWCPLKYENMMKLRSPQSRNYICNFVFLWDPVTDNCQQNYVTVVILFHVVVGKDLSGGNPTHTQKSYLQG